MSAETDTETDHKAEALRMLDVAVKHGKETGDPPLPQHGFLAALVYSNLAIAEGQERVAEALEGERALPRGVENGDLTRWILDGLELPADDPGNAEAARVQRVIQVAVEGWFAPAGAGE